MSAELILNHLLSAMDREVSIRESTRMAGVYKLEIRECEEDLKVLLRRQKTASAKERGWCLTT
jgi:hypothetical protein